MADGGAGVADGAGVDPGLATDLSATFHHGRDQDGFSVEVHAGGYTEHPAGLYGEDGIQGTGTHPGTGTGPGGKPA